jgi:hypothetical protein
MDEGWSDYPMGFSRIPILVSDQIQQTKDLEREIDKHIIEESAISKGVTVGWVLSAPQYLASIYR